MSSHAAAVAAEEAAAAAAAAAAHEFVVEAFTLLSIAIVFVILRTISRLMSVGIKQFKFDDYLIWFAITLYGLETGAAYTVGARFHGLANNGMSPHERISLSPTSEEYSLRVGGSKLQVIGWNLYTLLLWTMKMCVCVFYSRLTAGLDHMQLRVRIGYGLIISSYIAVMLSILLGCRPLHKNWQIYPNPGNYCQPAISKVNCLVTVTLNVATDLYLMSIPLPLMWKTQMPIKRKILLLFMFGGGFFVIAAGILRCVLILTDPVGGAQAAGSWAVRETFVAMIIGNLPMVYQLFRRSTKSISDKVTEMHRSRTGRHIGLSDDDGSKVPTYGGYDRSGYALGSKQFSQASKKSRFRHPLSMNTGATFSESQEDLQMNNVMKQDGCVVTTELSVESQKNKEALQDFDFEDAEYAKTGWVGRRNQGGL